MSERSDSPRPASRHTGRSPLVWVAAIGAVIVAMMFAVTYLDSRLESLEERLEYRPPQLEAEDPEPIHPERLTTGQTVYVPAYSHVYHRGGRAFLLEVTLSIRNTDPLHPMTLTSVDYYDTEGSKVRSFLQRPLRLKPLATTEFLVEEKDRGGGSGANFIVAWAAENEVNEPVIEAVMIGTSGSQGISFTSPGRVIAHGVPAAANPERRGQE